MFSTPYCRNLWNAVYLQKSFLISYLNHADKTINSLFADIKNAPIAQQERNIELLLKDLSQMVEVIDIILAGSMAALALDI